MREDPDNLQRIQDSHWSEDMHARRKPDHPVVRATFEPLADVVASSIDNPGESSVLDVGCGSGFLQWSLEKRFILAAGLDYSQQMLEVNPCREKHLGSCTNLPFPDGSFDVAVASHVLHHLSEPDRIRTLSEMRRVARKTVVSIEPNRNNLLMFLFCATKREERMALKFSLAYMRGLFVKAGFIDIQSHVEGWMVPNKAPLWWIPIGRAIGRSPLRRLGFDVCTVGRIGAALAASRETFKAP